MFFKFFDVIRLNSAKNFSNITMHRSWYYFLGFLLANDSSLQMFTTRDKGLGDEFDENMFRKCFEPLQKFRKNSDRI